MNLLVYAVIDGYPQHERTRRWWDAALNGDEPVGLCDVAIFGFVRIVTNPRILENPMTVDATADVVGEWFDRPMVSRIVPGADHVRTALRLLRTAEAAGNLTPDAQIAALAIEKRATVHSNDRDFLRFPDVRVVNPLQ
ncbi:TA system VapC family ribonuclease toxin [Tsukamurella pseudospumae]|uniref:TA system VapC family ribonuclease toxin n=1 Tax=Tsukamurella pseudospumae TaxID=239498 RepID=UPI0015869886|nr:TA system VapC family ribonuclease toxin [Tsukamurella pseudospumae]